MAPDFCLERFTGYSASDRTDLWVTVFNRKRRWVQFGSGRGVVGELDGRCGGLKSPVAGGLVGVVCLQLCGREVAAYFDLPS